MKRIIRLGLTLIFLLATSPGFAEDYQKNIFYQLNDIHWMQPVGREYGYEELFKYLHILDNDQDFAAYQKQHHWDLSMMENDGIFRLALNCRDFPVKKIPFYPILYNKTAVLAGFRDDTTESFRQLPEYLRRFCKEQLTAVQADPAQKDLPVVVGNLKEKVPELIRETFWLVTEDQRMKAEASSLSLSGDQQLGYRLELSFKESPPGAIFVFKNGNHDFPPKIVTAQPDLTKLPSILERDRVLIVPVNNAKDLLYVSSLEWTNSGFDLLWDNAAQSIVYLSVLSGYYKGDQPRNLNRNYFLNYGKRYYLLRMAETMNYAEVIYFEGNSLKKIVLLDEARPSLY